ncbi:MAG: preprotein translocase subunit SecG [Pseudomonadota bacterium]|jgi:preprotein translocase subunit SecG
MDVLIMVVHVISALGIIGLVLLQHGKGADMGAAFGSGSSGSVFGSAGSANFMSRTTAILAVIFFASSIGLTVVGSKKSVEKGLMSKEMPTQPADPAQSQSLPAQIPASPLTAPAPVVPVPGLPGSPVGSKSGEIPK